MPKSRPAEMEMRSLSSRSRTLISIGDLCIVAMLTEVMVVTAGLSRFLEIQNPGSSTLVKVTVGSRSP